MSGTKERFASNIGFVLASIGSAVGLGSIWKFPYEVGEHGGAGFLLFYALGLALVVFPLLLAEFVIGRSGRGDAATSIHRLTERFGRFPAWRTVGYLGIAGSFIILTYYAVIAGMTMAYVPKTLLGAFAGSDSIRTAEIYQSLIRVPATLGSWQAAFLVICVLVVARGVKGGIERTCTTLMPVLALLMVGLVLYAVVEGDFARAIDFMFRFDPSSLSPAVALQALGLGFFSIGVGMGVMITYAAYAGAKFGLMRAALGTLLGDTTISLMAGLAIFPMVFAQGLNPAEGTSLMFLTLPIAFGALPFGNIVGAAFFLLLFIAALASAISLLEVAVAPIVNKLGVSRARASAMVGLAAWLSGLPALFSFNIWADMRPLGWLGLSNLNIFEALDGLASNVLLPVAGMALSIFAGWALPASLYQAEIGARPVLALRVLLRWVVPAMIALSAGVAPWFY